MPVWRRTRQVGPRRLELGDVSDLPQQEVADLLAPRSGQHTSLLWREHGQRGVGAIVDRDLPDTQQACHLGVALALTQQQRQCGLLVGWEGVQSAHGCDRSTVAAEAGTAGS